MLSLYVFCDSSSKEKLPIPEELHFSFGVNVKIGFNNNLLKSNPRQFHKQKRSNTGVGDAASHGGDVARYYYDLERHFECSGKPSATAMMLLGGGHGRLVVMLSLQRYRG